jgi:hypothetical protein
MNEGLQFVTRHGAAVVFAAVFIEHLGVPLPATPWLLPAGALAATGKINLFVAILAAAFGSILASSVWGHCSAALMPGAKAIIQWSSPPSELRVRSAKTQTENANT